MSLAPSQAGSPCRVALFSLVPGDFASGIPFAEDPGHEWFRVSEWVDVVFEQFNPQAEVVNNENSKSE